jgi:glycosyltransferase involved in cell wall biosynthesis
MNDASDRAGLELESVLKTGPKAATADTVSVAEALRQERVATKSARSAARVLFISQDTTLLNPTTQSLDGYLNLKDLFEEVHILILRNGIPAKYPALRVEDNVWLYTATSKNWFTLHKAGVALAAQELAFADGFRPDLIVARDPFESALVGKQLSEKYDRPLQVHVLQNYTGEKFKHQAAKNFWRRFIPKHTISAATSVRADTAAVMDIVGDRFQVPDLELLPKYHAYESYIDKASDVDLKTKYPQFVFFFLFAGSLGADSTLFKTIDSLRFLLQNPRVGLLVLGTGPVKAEAMKRAELLGVGTQVIFEPGQVDEISYMKAADVLLVTNPDEAGNDTALKGAAAGVPLILAANEVRADYFEAGISAYLCPPEDTEAFAQAAAELLNNPGKRSQMREYAQDMVRHRFHRDKEQYRQAFRQSIEQTLFVGDDTDA